MKARGLKLLKQLADTGRGPGGNNVCKDQVEVMSGTLQECESPEMVTAWR